MKPSMSAQSEAGQIVALRLALDCLQSAAEERHALREGCDSRLRAALHAQSQRLAVTAIYATLTGRDPSDIQRGR